MEPKKMIKLLMECSRRAVKEDGKYKHMIFSQKKMIREPELRAILSEVLSESKITYGIEVPTRNKYGKGKNKARTDIAIYKNGSPIINIELKQGQPDYCEIEKDFQKLFKEGVIGSCFYHVLQNSDSGTLPSLIRKYNKAYSEANQESRKVKKWFLLFIFVAKQREYYQKSFSDITSIDHTDFDKIEKRTL